MSVNLTRLLTIVAFAVGIMAIFSVTTRAEEIDANIVQNLENSDYIFNQFEGFLNDVMGGSLNDVLTTLGATAAAVGTGVATLIKFS